MKKDINLLPWRLQQRRRQVKALVTKCVAGAVLCTAISVGLYRAAEQYAKQAEKLQHEYVALQRELQLTQQHIQQIRHHQRHDQETQAITKETVFLLLNQLAELPLTQGELSALSLSEQHLTLTGHSVNHEEFSRLNRFLSDQALFREVKLTEFKPQQQEMRFQFDLTLQAQP